MSELTVLSLSCVLNDELHYNISINGTILKTSLIFSVTRRGETKPISISQQYFVNGISLSETNRCHIWFLILYLIRIFLSILFWWRFFDKFQRYFHHLDFGITTYYSSIIDLNIPRIYLLYLKKWSRYKSILYNI